MEEANNNTENEASIEHMNMIKTHPLYPVLEMVFKKCELATKTNPTDSGEGGSSSNSDESVTVEGLHKEINDFMDKLTKEQSRYKLDLENRQVDRLVS